jgi:hypothetical protein
MRWFLLVSAILALSSHTLAQTPGGVPGTFRSFIVTDARFEGDQKARNRPDKMHCLVLDNGLNPAVAVFSRTLPNTPDAGVAKLAVKLQSLVTEKELKSERLGAYVIFLTLTREYPEDPKRDDSNKDVKALATQLKTSSVPFSLAPGKSADVSAWNIADTDDVTVVFYRKMSLVKKWTFTAENALKDEGILDISQTIESTLRSKKK